MHQAAKTIVKYGLILAAFVLLIILNIKVWKKDYDKEQQISLLQQELAYQQEENEKVKAINDDLKLKINSLTKGSNEMLEEKAREDFGMVREDETFYYYNEDEDKGKDK